MSSLLSKPEVLQVLGKNFVVMSMRLVMPRGIPFLVLLLATSGLSRDSTLYPWSYDDEAFALIGRLIAKDRSPYFEVLKKDFNRDNIAEILLYTATIMPQSLGDPRDVDTLVRRWLTTKGEIIPQFDLSGLLRLLVLREGTWEVASTLQLRNDLLGGEWRFGSFYHLRPFLVDCEGQSPETLLFVPSGLNSKGFTVIRVSNRLRLEVIGNFDYGHVNSVNVTTGLFEKPGSPEAHGDCLDGMPEILALGTDPHPIGTDPGVYWWEMLAYDPSTGAMEGVTPPRGFVLRPSTKVKGLYLQTDEDAARQED